MSSPKLAVSWDLLDYFCRCHLLLRALLHAVGRRLLGGCRFDGEVLFELLLQFLNQIRVFDVDLLLDGFRLKDGTRTFLEEGQVRGDDVLG